MASVMVVCELLLDLFASLLIRLHDRGLYAFCFVERIELCLWNHAFVFLRRVWYLVVLAYRIERNGIEG